jgi:hypothetical protein
MDNFDLRKYLAEGRLLEEGNIINVILDELEPTILDMVAKMKAQYEEKAEKKFTDSDREMARLSITSDMVRAIEKYTNPTDTLLSLEVSTSVKGNIEVIAEIKRDGVTYHFSTEAIYAGGYNIQRLHYRYLTRTNIPRTGASTITKVYSEKIKRMSKVERISKDLQQYKDRVAKAEEEVIVNSKLTDDEITQVGLEKDKWMEWPTWEEIIKRDAAKNYNNDEAEYNQKMKDYIAYNIDRWKHQNITWKKHNISQLAKEITKLEKKLSDLGA